MVVLIVGCGDSEAPFDGILKPPPTGEGMQLSFKVPVGPGEELTVCKNFAVPDGAFDIAKFEHAMTGPSHHLLVYALSTPAAEVTDDLIYACDEKPENQMLRNGFIYGTQSAESDLELPPGIVFPTRGGLSIQLEFHILNSSDEAAEAKTALNLWRAHGDVTGEAGMTFLYNNQIAVAPMSHSGARMRCSYPSDFELMMLVPHMHSRGVAMSAYKDHNGMRTKLFDVSGWENDTVIFDTPIQFEAGDTIDYQCDYDNQTTTPFFDGFSARHNEMCVTGGIYFRRGGDRMPLKDEVCWGRDVMFTGTNSCGQVQACDAAIDFHNPSLGSGPQLELCWAQGCNAATVAYQTLFSCEMANCIAECWTNSTGNGIDGTNYADPACTTCVAANCATERDGCAAATCQ